MQKKNKGGPPPIPLHSFCVFSPLSEIGGELERNWRRIGEELERNWRKHRVGIEVI